MSFHYVSPDDAIARSGLRMVVVGEVPSPWGEAAKGILHIKGIDWVAVRLAQDNEALIRWIGGQRSAPVAIYENERPRSGWAEILLLAERLEQTPPLLPADPAERVLAFGLAHEICGEAGLAWSRRLQLIHAGLEGAGGFSVPIANYLAPKYGYRPEAGAGAAARVAALLDMLAARLKTQRAVGSRYYVGDVVSAVDVYSATTMALFRPLPQEQCPMRQSTRAAFATRDAQTDAALDPILLEHRDRIYADHLQVPLAL
jgi:glutathione S-transferase